MILPIIGNYNFTTTNTITNENKERVEPQSSSLSIFLCVCYTSVRRNDIYMGIVSNSPLRPIL